MAKEKAKDEELSATGKQTVAHAYSAMDYYFDHLKKTVSSAPSGGTEFGERVVSLLDTTLWTSSPETSARTSPPRLYASWRATTCDLTRLPRTRFYPGRNAVGEGAALIDIAFEPVLRTEVSVAGKRNFQRGDKEAKTTLKIQGRRCRDKITPGNSANSGLIAGFREISVRMSMRRGLRRVSTGAKHAVAIEPVSRE